MTNLNAAGPAGSGNDSTAEADEDPRLPGLRATLDRMDEVLLLYVIGCPAHLGIVGWAFLDLVQPVLNRRILAVDATDASSTDTPCEIRTGWGESLVYLGSPLLLATLAVVTYVAVASIVAAYRIGARFTRSGTNTTTTTTTPTFTSDVDKSITAFSASIFGGMAFVVVFYIGPPHFGSWLFSPHMLWIYQMLSLETVLLLVVAGASSLLYLLVGAILAANNDDSDDDDVGPPPRETRSGGSRLGRLGRQYVTEDYSTLITALIFTLGVTGAWYGIRFDESADWQQRWRHALQYNADGDAN